MVEATRLVVVWLELLGFLLGWSAGRSGRHVGVYFNGLNRDNLVSLTENCSVGVGLLSRLQADIDDGFD